MKEFVWFHQLNYYNSMIQRSIFESFNEFIEQAKGDQSNQSWPIDSIESTSYLINFIDLNFIKWNYLIQQRWILVQMKFPSTCVFKLNTRVEMKDVRVNKINQIKQSEIELPLDYRIDLYSTVQFISLQLMYSNWIYGLKWKMNGLNTKT